MHWLWLNSQRASYTVHVRTCTTILHEICWATTNLADLVIDPFTIETFERGDCGVSVALPQKQSSDASSQPAVFTHVPHVALYREIRSVFPP